MGKTSIEWTDESSNMIKFRERETGKQTWACIRASEGCQHCYSERLNKRFGSGLDFTASNMLKVEPYLDQREIDRLSRLKEPHRIFLGDMTDIFGSFIPDEMIDTVFDVMTHCENQIFQVLTKRPERMLEYFRSRGMGEGMYCMPGNIWLGVSVENQKWADARIPLLLQMPAAIRFVSCEPLLGTVDLGIGACPDCGGCGETAGHYSQDDGMDTCDCCGGSGRAIDKLDWVICGGESGPGARPMHPQWARSLRDQCQNADVPFFFKQWGEWWPGEQGRLYDISTEKKITWTDGQEAYRVGKKAAGRLLDDREWNEFPETVP